MSWPFVPPYAVRPLQMFGYGAIMADPDWSFSNWSEKGEAKNAKAHYACSSLDEIKALPVGQLAGRDCWLWLWATHPMLPQALETMAAWGFTYSTSGPWVKRQKSGKLAFGTGYIFRQCSEMILIGKIGEPQLYSKSIRGVLEAPRREHSRKPDEAYDRAERLFGPVFRADLFARQIRPGWDGWGDELTKFEGGST